MPNSKLIQVPENLTMNTRKKLVHHPDLCRQMKKMDLDGFRMRHRS